MKRIKYYCEVCGEKFHARFINENGEVMFLCSKHHKHMTRWGEIRQRTRCTKNEIIKVGDFSEVVLYDKKCKEIARALVDEELVGVIEKYKWGAAKKGGLSLYVKTEIGTIGKRRTLYLAELVLGKKKGFQIDHISGNTLDNRLKNLRHVTQQQNLLNRHGVKGYYYCKDKGGGGVWCVYIGVEKRRIWCGRVKTEEEAKKIRLEAEKKYWGEFAPTRDN